VRRIEPQLRRRVPVMSAAWLRAIAATGLSMLAAGCVPIYRPPTAADAHATLKLRRVYEKTAGTRLDETCLVNGHQAVADSADSSVATAPRTDALLIYPVPARLQVSSQFVHQEVRTVNEAYTVQVPYMTSQFYSCGFGTSTQMCSRMVTQYRTETRFRLVTKPVDVVDGACAQALYLAPKTNHVYLVDFTYRDHQVCEATCVEQAASADGSFQNSACPLPTPAQTAAIDTR
jgi:hypothetical protein